MFEKPQPKTSTPEPLDYLLARVGQGDAAAFARLHQRTCGKMRKSALQFGATTSDIDDILQDSYLKIWRNAATFDVRRASVITWMSTIVRNTTISAMRLRKPTSDLDEALNLPALAHSGVLEDGFDYEFASSSVSAALVKLPQSRRELITLAYLSNESRASLAFRFGVPVGTIKTWLRRTLQALREDCLSTSRDSARWKLSENHCLARRGELIVQSS